MFSLDLPIPHALVSGTFFKLSMPATAELADLDDLRTAIIRLNRVIVPLMEGVYGQYSNSLTRVGLVI